MGKRRARRRGQSSASVAPVLREISATLAPVLRKILVGVGAVIALISAVFVVVFVSELVTGGDGQTEPGVLVGLVVFFLGTGACGIWMASANSRTRPPGPPPAPPLTEEDREQRILDLAHEEGGRVTIPEVASRCDFSLEEAEATLNRMAAEELADLHVTDDGVVVYVFRGFVSDKEKRSATEL